jgi:hypothetical protein
VAAGPTTLPPVSCVGHSTDDSPDPRRPCRPLSGQLTPASDQRHTNRPFDGRLARRSRTYVDRSMVGSAHAARTTKRRPDGPPAPAHRNAHRPLSGQPADQPLAPQESATRRTTRQDRPPRVSTTQRSTQDPLADAAGIAADRRRTCPSRTPADRSVASSHRSAAHAANRPIMDKRHAGPRACRPFSGRVESSRAIAQAGACRSTAQRPTHPSRATARVDRSVVGSRADQAAGAPGGMTRPAGRALPEMWPFRARARGRLRGVDGLI